MPVYLVKYLFFILQHILQEKKRYCDVSFFQYRAALYPSSISMFTLAQTNRSLEGDETTASKEPGVNKP